MPNHYLILSVLLAASSVQAAVPARCELVGSNNRLTGQAISLDELERIGLRYASRNPRAPQVPFAYGNKTWVQLKGLYREGDQIYAYEQLWPPSGKPFSWGYALVRKRCILGVIGTRVE
jgi:hypothetical protein